MRTQEIITENFPDATTVYGDSVVGETPSDEPQPRADELARVVAVRAPEPAARAGLSRGEDRQRQRRESHARGVRRASVAAARGGTRGWRTTTGGDAAE